MIYKSKLSFVKLAQNVSASIRRKSKRALSKTTLREELRARVNFVVAVVYISGDPNGDLKRKFGGKSAIG